MACASSSLSFLPPRPRALTRSPTPTPSSPPPLRPSLRRPPSGGAAGAGAVRAARSARLTQPFDPKNDPFLSTLASASPEALEAAAASGGGKDRLPYMELFQNAKLMSSPSQVEHYGSSYNEHKAADPPPDLPSLLLHGRIVYIGMPLVPAVTELIISQLFYLEWMNNKEPIYIYINSTGTARDDGEPVGLESEGFGIYDAMTRMKNEIYTLGIGSATGHACLILAAGTKGKRYMFPHAQALIQNPRASSYGMMPASDLALRAKEVLHNTNTLIRLLARHTRNPPEKIANLMKGGPFYMSAIEARELGVIDKILWRGNEKYMADILPPEEWDKIAGVKPGDGI